MRQWWWNSRPARRRGCAFPTPNPQPIETPAWPGGEEGCMFPRKEGGKFQLLPSLVILPDSAGDSQCPHLPRFPATTPGDILPLTVPSLSM